MMQDSPLAQAIAILSGQYLPDDPVMLLLLVAMDERDRGKALLKLKHFEGGTLCDFTC